MVKLNTIFETINKIIELEAVLEREIRKVKNVTRRKKFKKLCQKALKNKDPKSISDVRNFLFKL